MWNWALANPCRAASRNQRGLRRGSCATPSAFWQQRPRASWASAAPVRRPSGTRRRLGKILGDPLAQGEAETEVELALRKSLACGPAPPPCRLGAVHRNAKAVHAAIAKLELGFGMPCSAAERRPAKSGTAEATTADDGAACPNRDRSRERMEDHGDQSADSLLGGLKVVLPWTGSFIFPGLPGPSWPHPILGCGFREPCSCLGKVRGDSPAIPVRPSQIELCHPVALPRRLAEPCDGLQIALRPSPSRSDTAHRVRSAHPGNLGPQP